MKNNFNFLPNQYFKSNKIKINHSYLSEQFSDYKKIFKRLEKVINVGDYTLGNEVDKFEKNICKRMGSKYAIGVGNGTDALLLTLKALNIGSGDEVITTPFTFIATVGSIVTAGAKPVFVDVKKDYNIDETKIEKKITKKTKAIIVVYFTGYYKKIKELKAFCKKKGIIIVEDCAQSFGSLNQKEPNGKFGDLSCFSMNPMKVFGGFGDAGAVCVNSLKIANKIKSLRYAGTIKKEIVIDSDLNHKIDSLQALILLKQLKFLKNKIRKRIQNARFYENELTSKVIKPKFFSDFRHVYYTYSILVEKREELINYLNKYGIETKVQHPYIISDHPDLKNKFNKNLKKSKYIADRILSIPVHEKLKKNQLRYIVKKINLFYKNV